MGTTAVKWLSVAALLRYGAIIGQGREHPSVMTGGSPGGERSGNRATRSDDTSPLEAVVTQLTQELTSLKAQLEAARTEITEAKGSTFIRWGRTTCPVSSHLVHSGVGGGSHFLDNGGSANRLCLSLQPEFDAIVPPVDAVSKIYGAEFELIADKLNYEVPCSVCRAAHSSTVMIPGTQTCPPGWTVQYWGHLTGGYYGDHTPGDYLCVDNTPEGLGAGGNEDGALLFYTVAACGSLPCPPYVNGRVVTCVVCSQ